MADPVLHIKDSYYFEVPKVLYPYDYKSARQFPPVWVSLDPEFQSWEFERLYQELTVVDAGLPAKADALHDWNHWVHADHANFAKPFDVFLEEKYQTQIAKFNDWKSAQKRMASRKNDGSIDAAKRLTFKVYLRHLETSHTSDASYLKFLEWRHEHARSFEQAKDEAGGSEAIRTWKELVGKPEVADWSPGKIAAYNKNLSGKILIPQPFATLRNLYESDSGFAISKYMVLQVVIGLVLLVVFGSLAKRFSQGGAPRGYVWNLLETFLIFIRDQIVRPSLGGHHEEHGDHADAHGAGHAPAEHAHAAHAHAGEAAHHVDDAARLLPLFWTIFFFVLACNLFGMVPWLGAPSASFSVTTGLALITLVVGLYVGIKKFGFWGHLGNQIPAMDLPIYIAVFVKPLVYGIEVMGLMIKHGVLAIRLLANMVAGHLVILGIMGIAFGASAAVAFSQPGTPDWQWWVAAVIAVVAATLFNLLELFVAFLQAYIFTFLSALFIGATLHKH